MKNLLILLLFSICLYGCKSDDEKIFATPIEETDNVYVESEVLESYVIEEEEPEEYPIVEEDGWLYFNSETLNISMYLNNKEIANRLVSSLIENNIEGTARIIEDTVPVNPEAGSDEDMRLSSILSLRPDYDQPVYYRGEVNDNSLHIFVNADGSLDLVISTY